MNSSITFIFKTLIKVPVIILVSYFIFNVFAFGLVYFKLLGISYVAMQVAAENNFVPAQEMNTIQAYLDNLSLTEIVDNASIVVPDNTKKQYGEPVTVRITADYKFIFPLTPREQLVNTEDKFTGYGDSKSTSFHGFADNATLEARRSNNISKNNIVIEYTVPGLKYYPDLY